MAEPSRVDVPLASVSDRVPPRERLATAWQTYGAFGALLLLILYNVFFTRNFLSANTPRIILTQVAPIVIVATGMTLVIATGGIDLSVGSLMAIAGALAPMIFLSHRWPLDQPAVGDALAFVLPILVAGAFGIFNGFLVTTFRIQPIIATLVLYLGGRGIAQVLTNGKLQEFNNGTFEYIGRGRPFGIPFQVILMVLIVAAAAWAMRTTTFGRYVLAAGGNEPAARLAGVPVSRVKLTVYGISGLLAGLAGLIFVAINKSSDPSNIGFNPPMELDAIAAVAVGGTPLTGGRATIAGTFVGALIIQLLRTTLLSHGVRDGTARVVIAAAIILAVLIQRQRTT